MSDISRYCPLCGGLLEDMTPVMELEHINVSETFLYRCTEHPETHVWMSPRGGDQKLSFFDMEMERFCFLCGGDLTKMNELAANEFDNQKEIPLFYQCSFFESHMWVEYRKARIFLRVTTSDVFDMLS